MLIIVQKLKILLLTSPVKIISCRWFAKQIFKEIRCRYLLLQILGRILVPIRTILLAIRLSFQKIFKFLSFFLLNTLLNIHIQRSRYFLTNCFPKYGRFLRQKHFKAHFCWLGWRLSPFDGKCILFTSFTTKIRVIVRLLII